MQIKHKYQQRPVRFIEVYQQDEWRVKIYTISVGSMYVKSDTIKVAKNNLHTWLQQSKNYPLETYNIATLILHQCKEGCFAVVNWWIDENMLQNHVYLASPDKPDEFIAYSDKGISTCVWEMAIWWYERNLWVKYVLKKPKKPDITTYLNKSLNALV